MGTAGIGDLTKIVGSRPKTVIFWPFLAFEGRFGGLKDPPEVRVEDKTCPGQVQALTSKRLILGGVSFRVISSPMNAAIRTRRRGSPDQNWLV